MLSRLFSIVFLLVSSVTMAQFVVNPATLVTVGKAGFTNIVIQSAGDVILTSPVNFKNAVVDVILSGSGNLVNGSAKADSINSLTLNGTGNYSVTGKWVVQNSIDFENGNLVVPSATVLNDHVTYLGSDAGITNASAQSHVFGPFFIKSTGTLTFPLGSATDYYPAQLEGANDPTAVYGMSYVAADPSIPVDSLSADVDQVFTSWHWRLAIFNRSNFAGVPISLSLNGADNFLGTEKAVVIEKDSVGYINDLSGSLNAPYVTSSGNVFVKGGIYAIGRSKDVSIKIHKIITPNGDGHNENLVIEGIDAYNNNNNPGTSNKVTLLDRWGAVYFQKDNFANYASNVAQQADFDYSKLNNGNYICIVEYKDSTGKTYKPKPQMITVIK